MRNATTRAGLLFVLVGPSGVGKNTLMQAALNHFSNLAQLPTATTRGIRDGEQEGREHFFKTRSEFERLIEADALVEWQWVHEELYGVMRSTVEEAMDAGADRIADVEVLGAKALDSAYADNVSLIFVTPPDRGTLEKRIRVRGGADEAEIQRRLRRANFEMGFAPMCDYLIINDDLEQAQQELINIIHTRRSQRQQQHMIVKLAVFNQAGEVLAARNSSAMPECRAHSGEDAQQSAFRLLAQTGINDVQFRSQTIEPEESITPVYFQITGQDAAQHLELIYACETNTPAPQVKPGWQWRSIEDVPLAKTVYHIESETLTVTVPI